MVAMPMASAGRFSPLGPRGILVLDLSDGISGLAKSNRHSFGEVDTFFVAFRDLVPRRAMPRTGMINKSGLMALVMTMRLSSDIRVRLQLCAKHTTGAEMARPQDST